MTDIFDEVVVDISTVDTIDLIRELRRRKRVPIGWLRNGQWFNMASHEEAECIGVKVSGTLEIDVKAAFLAGHHTNGVGPFVISSQLMVYPISDPRRKSMPIAQAIEGAPIGEKVLTPTVVSAPPPRNANASKLGVAELLGSGLLKSTDLLVVTSGGKSAAVTINPDGTLCIGIAVYSSVSAAALSALEMLGKVRAAVNGWAAFTIRRNGQDIGTLADLREQVRSGVLT